MTVALKKLALALITDRKARQRIITAVCLIFVLLLMPVAAVVAIANTELSFDVDAIKSEVLSNMTYAEQRELRKVETVMGQISDIFAEEGLSEHIMKAQVLFALALSDYMDEPGFVYRLAWCFDEEREIDPVTAVNMEFGTDIDAQEFYQLMQYLDSVTIDASDFSNPNSKNNYDLVRWAESAADNGWGYVWGTYGQLMTESLLEAKAKQYPKEVGDYESYIRSHWLNCRVADCVGLIKGYSWFDPETGSIVYGSNDMPDIDCDTMYRVSQEKGSIDTMPEIPGLAVWKQGHIGIYIGNGQVIEAYSTMRGVIRSNLDERGWTHWCKIRYINYVQPGHEVIEIPDWAL